MENPASITGELSDSEENIPVEEARGGLNNQFG